MKATQQWLKDANVVFDSKDFDNKIPAYVHMALLNPDCWQAVGKTRGWEFEAWLPEKAEFRLKMAGFMRAIAGGKTIEEVLQAIE